MRKLIIRYRMGKAHRRYERLGYELRARRMAVAYSGIIKPKWVGECYTPSLGSDVILSFRFPNAASLVESLERVLECIRERKGFETKDKVTGSVKVSLDNWLMDSQKRTVSAEVLTQKVIELVPRISEEIASCQLSRNDLLEYYQLNTIAHMDDVVLFLESMLKLKLNK